MILKNELQELINEKPLTSLFFFGILFLDALGAILPSYLDRRITLFIPIPLIFIVYALNANKKNKLFLLSLVFNFLGICTFNNPYQEYNSIGVIFHAIAFFIYSIILFKQYQIISIKNFLKFSIIILLFIVIPSIIYSKGIIKMQVSYEIMLYLFSISTFILGTFMLYVNNKTNTNRFLVFAIVSIFLSSYSQGYNLFIEDSNFMEFLAVIFFNLTHYFMCWYLIRVSRNMCQESVVIT